MARFSKRVYKIVKKIPKGKVATYKVIAKAIGDPKYARAVGQALSKNKDKDVPCHRVIRSDGRLGGYQRGTKEKISKLKREGIIIEKEKTDLKKFEWKPWLCSFH